jgi:histidinol-phosphate phosphatase family protein
VDGETRYKPENPKRGVLVFLLATIKALPAMERTMHRDKNFAIFLDRDGTIIEDGGHLKFPSDVVFFPETFNALRKLQDYFSLFIVTNQPGVAEGEITFHDVNRVNHSIIRTLLKKGITIQDVYTCPHRRLDNCCCIKPKPYFLKRAAKQYGLELHRSFTIGDHPHDVQLAKNADAQGIYVLTGHGQKHFAELPRDTEVVEGILEATEKIISKLDTEATYGTIH